MNKPTNEYIMAIKPEWVALIESKQKTLEIRRTAPYISPRKIEATEYWDDRAVDVAIIETRQILKEETRRRQAAWNTAKRAYQVARWPWQRWQLKREARRACCDYLDVYIAQRNAEAHKICEAARAAYEKAYAKRSAE